MNNVVLIGNLVADPEITLAADCRNRCTFRIAVSRDYINKETGKRDADYIRIVTWGGLADVCARHLSKGKKVAVSGKLKGRSIPNEDGTSFYTTEVKADYVDFLSPKETPDESKTDQTEGKHQFIDEDDPKLPF